MPSCVVKWCKNYGKKCNKSQGITYHTFPRNENLKHDWVQIIRNSRNENSWNPSSSSTVCSEHFDNDDFKITANGMRCLVPGAIPEKISPNVRGMTDDPEPSSTLDITSSLMQVSEVKVEMGLLAYCRLCAAKYCNSELLNIQSDDDLYKLIVKMTSRLNANVDFNQRHLPTTICSECVKKLYTAYDLVIGIDLAQMTLSGRSTQNDQCLMPINMIFSNNIGSSTSLQQDSPKIEAETSNIERSLLLDSPRKLRLKYDISKKKLLIERQRKNLKRLNQKVRRLQNRNESLRNIIKNNEQRHCID